MYYPPTKILYSRPAIALPNMWETISKYSKKLHDKGYMGSRAGNISFRKGDAMVIKRHASDSDEIGEKDVVEVLLKGPLPQDASVEADVHRAIYNQTKAQAIVHAHPPYSIACSVLYGEIVPVDVETEYHLTRVPVVEAEVLTGSKELGIKLAKALDFYKGAIVYRHGTFAAGHTLEDAYHTTCLIEMACKVMYLVENGRKEY